MKEFLFVLIVTLTLAYGKNGKNGSDGQDGASTLGLNSSDAISTGVDFSDIARIGLCQWRHIYLYF
jgi:hypothetical protein